MNYNFSEKDINNAVKFYEKILLSKYNATKDKKAIFMGGQPGAGKTAVSRKINEKKDYIPIDIDSFRNKHPRLNEILRDQPENYANLTGDFAWRVKMQIIDDFSKEGYNIMLDQTLRNANEQSKIAEKLVDRGYSNSIKVMCVKKEISYMSTVLRDEEDAYRRNNGDKTAVPRPVPKAYHDSVVDKELPASLNTLQSAKYKGKNLFTSVQLYDRSATCLLDTSVKNVPSGDALKRKNQKPYNKNEFKQLQSTVKETCKLKLLNNSSDIEEFTKESNNIVKSVGKKMSKGLRR